MLAKKLYDFRAVLQQEGIMFAYSGYVTEPVLHGVGEALKRQLEIQDADTMQHRLGDVAAVGEHDSLLLQNGTKVIELLGQHDGLLQPKSYLKPSTVTSSRRASWP